MDELCFIDCINFKYFVASLCYKLNLWLYVTYDRCELDSSCHH